MNTKIMKSLAGLAFALSATVAHAVGIYTYTGNNYAVIEDDILETYSGTYDTNMSVSGNFTLSSLVPANPVFQSYLGQVLDWEINDGRNTLTPGNSVLFGLDFKTDALGVPNVWNFSISSKKDPSVSVGDPRFSIKSVSSNGDSGAIFICVNVSTLGQCDFSRIADRGQTVFLELPGSWSVAAVPLPATLWLFGSGLIGLIGVIRRKQT